MDRLLTLRSSELLADIPEDPCKKLEPLATERHCQPGEVIFRLGDEAPTLYVIASGGVDLTFPLRIMGELKDVRFQTLDSGQVLSWSALVPPYKLTMSARAALQSVLLAFPREPLLKLFMEDCVLGFRVMANLARVVGLRLQEQQALWVREVQRNVSHTYR
jgi:CRP-like cAMP-binding protein